MRPPPHPVGRLLARRARLPKRVAIVLLSATVACGAGGAVVSGADLPRGFFPGTGKLRLEVGGEPVTLDLPASFDAASLSVEPRDGLVIRLVRTDEGRGGALTILHLPRADEPSPVLRLSIRTEDYKDARAASFRPPYAATVRGGGTYLLALEDAGLDAARGLYRAADDQGLDLSAIDASLTLSRLGAPGTGRFEVSGVVPPGRELDVLTWREVPGVLGFSRRRGDVPETRSGARLLLGRGVTAERVVSLIEAVRRASGPQPSLHVELDDGWQKGGGRALRAPARDWLAVERDAFPSGLAGLSRELRQRNARLGLWVVPFGFGEIDSLDAFVLDEEGKAIADPDLGPLVVDPTSEAGRTHLLEVFGRLRGEGCDALRLAHLAAARSFYTEHRERLREPGDDAFRRGLATLREAFGDDGLLLGSETSPRVALGSLDGVRPEWELIAGISPWAQELRAAGRCLPLSLAGLSVECLPIRGWAASPDPSLVARARASRVLFAALTGRSISLDPGRPSQASVDEIRVAIAAPVRGLETGRPDATPSVWVVKTTGPQGPLDVLGVVNASELETRVVQVERAALRLARRGPYLAFSLERAELLGVTDLPLDVMLLPAETRAFLVQLVDPREPRVAGVGPWSGDPYALHGLVRRASYEASSSTLRMDVAKSAGASTVHVFVPEGLEPLAARLGDQELTMELRGRDELRVHLPARDAAGALSVRFRASVPEEIGPRDDMLASVGEDPASGRPLLRWTRARRNGRRPGRYAVYRDARLVRVSNDNAYLGESAVPGERRVYVVLPADESLSTRLDVGPAQLESRGGARIEWLSPPGEHRFLSDLAPLVSTTSTLEWARDRSVHGAPLTVRGKSFERGIGVASPTTLVYNLRAAYRRFEVSVAVDDASRLQGSVVFVVVVDGVERERTRVVRGLDDEPLEIGVDVSGARRLDLIVEDAGDGSTSDFADWLEPRLFPAERP